MIQGRRETAAYLGAAIKRIQDIRERDRCENSLAEFLKCAWPSFDPADFVDNWHLHAICEHLEAVAHGEIPRLLINVPPRTAKTSVCSVCFPAWVWAQGQKGPLMGPQVSFFYASYAEQLSLEHSLKTRRLVESRWYKKHWGKRFTLVSDRNTKGHFENSAGGYRMASSVDARAAGFGADILIADDPHLVKEAESELVREGVVRWWTETMPSRLNDRRTGAMIVVMQRVHEGDLSGHILTEDLGYEHLMLPMTCDEQRIMVNGARYETSIGFTDPRDDGELLWPERFPETEIVKLQKELGPYAFAGQYEQAPAPRGGGILKEEWWQPWAGAIVERNGAIRGQFPRFEYILASLDTAYTEKEENDPSALSLWGVWRETKLPEAKDAKDFIPASRNLRLGKIPPPAPHMPDDGSGNLKIMMMYCWQERLELHNLVSKVAADCKKFKVDRLIIEDKAAGHSVSQELYRLFGRFDFGIELVNPRTGFIKSADKVARVHAVVHLFSEGLVYTPFEHLDRGELVEAPPDYVSDMIEQCAVFPRGRHDDLVDSMSQAMLYLRRVGLAKLAEEQAIEDASEMEFRPRRSTSGALYPA